MGARFDHLATASVSPSTRPPTARSCPPSRSRTFPCETEAAWQRHAPPAAHATPRPVRRSVDVKLHLNPRQVFASQVTTDWCAVAGTQIVLAMHGVLDNSEEAQRRLAGRIDQWESWKDSHNGGWGPSAIAQALAAHGVKGYEIRAYRRRDTALRDAAIALMRDAGAGRPHRLARGPHLGHDRLPADADPTVFRDAIDQRHLHLRPLVPARLHHLGCVGRAGRLPERRRDGAQLPALGPSRGRVPRARRHVPRRSCPPSPSATRPPHATDHGRARWGPA